ncbi:S-layer homology domain-containing protein [Planococcus liqunii]|uniref:S-layer homology domain-containing protein n=1 Tax=Planococcus liqunii TaxID=3058394 RepID=UPI0026170F44|nr:S-layer homology domain-containing protein [Planococcus sp. N056]WKA50248.1 S-layer homology domain-containing protein [Planococcus sp. N056]
MLKTWGKAVVVWILFICLYSGSTGTAQAAITFKDLQTSHWAYEDIQSLVGKKVLSGFSNDTFKPNENITRAQAAKVLSLAADIKPIQPESASFSDVSKGHWAFAYIEALKKQGIVDGKTDGTFGPDEVLTRGQMAKFLSASFKLEGTAAVQFRDVKETDWKYPYVMAMRVHGITVGYPEDNTYRPEEIVTRAQMAAFANRALLQKAKIIAFGDSNTSGSYLPREFPEYPNHSWPSLLAVKNAGVSGNTTENALKRLKTDVLDHKPNTVIMMFGLNDALIRSDTKKPQVDKVQFEQNLVNMIGQMKKQQIEVILMTNLPVHEETYYKAQSFANPDIRKLYADQGGIRAWENSYNDIIRKIARQQNLKLIDNYANAIQKAGTATDAGIAKSGLVDPLLGFHWTPRGHLMVEYSVRQYIK